MGTGAVINHFFELSSTGRATLLEGIYLIYGADTVAYRYYDDFDSGYPNTPEITEDEYQSIIEQYTNAQGDIAGMELNWEQLVS